jgi:hypothetical protein
MILRSWCAPIPPPTAPMCASKAPTETTTSVDSPSFFAHAAESFPKGSSAVKVSAPKLALSAGSLGCSFARKASAG